MKEQQPKLLEEIDTHKEGGLTPNNWRLILEKIDTSKSDKSAKIASYAQKVMTGEFPATGFHHRSYLGERHWRSIKGLVENLEKQGNKLASETLFYARFEQYGTYTLNDYIEDDLFSRGVSPPRIFSGHNEVGWSNIDNSWYEYVNVTEEDDQERRELREDVNAKTILNLWLLDQADVADPVHTPPEALLAILLGKARISPLHETQERLKQSKTFRYYPWWDLWLTRAVVSDLLGERKGKSPESMTSWELSDEREYNNELIKRLQELYQQHYGVQPFVVSDLRTFAPFVVFPTPDYWERIVCYRRMFSLGRQSWRIDPGDYGSYRPSSELPQTLFGQLEKEI